MDIRELIKYQYIPRNLHKKVADLLFALENHCSEMAYHLVDVSNLCLKIAMESGNVEINNPETLSRLYTAAIMHDIGKLDVPYELLVKKGKLTDKEKAFIQVTHLEGTYKYLTKHKFPKDIIDIAYHHHERLDGSGYMLGICSKDKEYTQCDKLLQVADVAGSMLMERSYRGELNPVQVVIPYLKDLALNKYDEHGELERGAQLDSQYVNIVSNIIRDRYTEIKKNYQPIKNEYMTKNTPIID